MRSDFPGEFQTHPALANVDYATVTVDSMLLAEIVEKPAALSGVRFRDLDTGEEICDLQAARLRPDGKGVLHLDHLEDNHAVGLDCRKEPVRSGRDARGRRCPA